MSFCVKCNTVNWNDEICSNCFPINKSILNNIITVNDIMYHNKPCNSPINNYSPNMDYKLANYNTHYQSN